ncbi:MAG: carbon-nitrogen hydrolase [Planctomycetes bacterium]|nr:carbon-nitrogen hydrolase [Planctomycetota bacterium]
MTIRIQLAQVEPTLGNLEANRALHLAEVEAARSEGAQAICFPELSLTGYFLKDQTPEVALSRESAFLEPLVEASRRISIGLGFVERGRDGRTYNSYAWLEDGLVVGLHRKVHLVSYGMFEESRDLAAGEHYETIESKLGRLGVLICEDLWHMEGAWLYFQQGVDALIVPSASPARGVEAGNDGLGSVRTWRSLLETTATMTQSWVVHVNRTGWEDGISFGGGSRVIDPYGAQVGELAGLDAGRLHVDVDPREAARARTRVPLRRDEKPWILRRELERLAEEDSR